MSRVIVEVRGGMVQEVYSDDPAIKVFLVDWDTEGCAPDDEDIVAVEGDLVRVVNFPTTIVEEMPPETDEALRQATEGLAPP